MKMSQIRITRSGTSRLACACALCILCRLSGHRKSAIRRRPAHIKVDLIRTESASAASGTQVATKERISFESICHTLQ